MAAELHLAEDALALHLLLQHLEGLVDIVVTDENLHAAFLFDRAVDDPRAKALGPLAHGYAQLGTDGSHGMNQRRYFKTVPADGHAGCQWKKRRLRYVAVFWAALQASQCLPCILNGRAGNKEQ